VVWEVMAAHAYGPEKEIVRFHLTIPCFVLCFGCHITSELWIAIWREGILWNS
jgi:hypothetical protein